MTADNVINLNERRAEKPNNRVTLEAIGKAADSGTKPFVGLASDGQYYWCKRLHSGHHWQAAVNEIAVATVGQALEAPVRDWKIVDVPPELQGYLFRFESESYRLDSLPLFGSLNLHTADLAANPAAFTHVRDDGNYNRIPLLIALQILCNSQDLQVMYDPANDHSIWSIDHGLWFGSDEFPWVLQDESTLYGRTIFPKVAEPINMEHWDRAIHAVESLPLDLAVQLTSSLPSEWEIDSADSDKLIKYVYSRRQYATDRLVELKNTHGRR